MSFRFNKDILCKLFDSSGSPFEPLVYADINCGTQYMLRNELNGEPFRLQPLRQAYHYAKLECFGFVATGMVFLMQHLHTEHREGRHFDEVRLYFHFGYDEEKLEEYRQNEMMANFEPTQLFGRNTHVGKKNSGPVFADTPIIGRTCHFPVETWREWNMHSSTLGGRRCDELSYIWTCRDDGAFGNVKHPNVHTYGTAMAVYLKLEPLLSLNVHIDNQFHAPTMDFLVHDNYKPVPGEAPERWTDRDDSRIVYKTYWKQFDFQKLNNFGLIAPEHDRSRGAKNRGKQSKRESVTV